MHRMRELLYQETSVHHLEFSPMKGIFCVPLYSLIVFEMISIFWQLSLSYVPGACHPQDNRS